MLKNILKAGAIVLLLTLSFSVYAGKVELTTYYPAPYGEYSELKSTGKTTENGNVAFSASGSAGTGLVVTDANRVGIGVTVPQGALDITSTTLAFFPPRVTTDQRNSIASNTNPVDAKKGAVVYNTTTRALEFYNGKWVQASASAAGLSAYRGYDTNTSRCPDNTGSFTGNQVCNAIGRTCIITQRDDAHSCTENTDCRYHGGPNHNAIPVVVFCQ